MFVKHFKLFTGQSNSSILLRGTFSSLSIKLCGAFLGFFVQILLARLLGLEQFGYFVYGLAWLNIFVLISKLGTDTSLIRYIPEYTIKQNWSSFRGLLVRSSQGVLLVSLLIGILASLFVWIFQERLGQDLSLVFWVSFIFIPVLSLSGLRQAALRSLKVIAYAEIPDRIIRPTAFGLFLSIVFMLNPTGLQAADAMLLNGLSFIIAFYIGTLLLNKSLPSEVKKVPPVFDTQNWLKVSFPLLLIAGMHLLLKRTDIIMVGALTDPSSTGIYAASVRVSDLVVFALASVNAIAAPMISELYYSDRREDLQKIITQATRGIFFFSVVVTLILLVGGKFILSLFGEEFTAGYTVLVILLTGQVINSFVGSVGYLMSMTGNQKQASIIVVSSALLNIILNAFLIPLYGILGAALATAFSMACWNLIMLVFVKRKLNIDPTIIGSLS